jgi:NADPH:quinone reductase-like Zn-dependent oxidoreductase
MNTLRVSGWLVGCAVALAAARAGLPQTMQAAAIDHTGGPEVLTVHTLPVPAPGAEEVLIALHTAGVGPWDVDIRERLDYWKNRHYPLVLGVDGAGTVVAVGSQVQGFRVGDPVYSYVWDNPKGGFYAEFVAVPAKAVGHVPAGMNLRDAGAAAVTALTAQQGIDDALHVKAGETIIIHGASGGVGTLAVQFAKLRGARVLAIASGTEGVSLARRLGADVAVDGHNADIAAAAQEFAHAGVDAVLALAGGAALEHCIAALKPGGRVAYPSGVDPVPKVGVGVKLVRYDATAGPSEFERLNEAILAAKLQVPIAAEYPLADAAKAQQRVAAGHVLGKVVLRIH